MYPSYQQYYYPQFQPNASLQQLSQPQMPIQNGGSFYFVNSQKEVEDWVIGAGQTAFFFERNNPVFYIKSIAQNGLAQPIEVYDYTQRVAKGAPEASVGDLGLDLDNYITREEFTKLEARINAFMQEESKDE